MSILKFCKVPSDEVVENYNSAKYYGNKKIINRDFQIKIEEILKNKMQEYLETPDAEKLLNGKEPGHSMGTMIEEECGNLLKQNGYTITKEVNKLGDAKKRAHSDFNIVSVDGSVHRVNVKFGSEGDSSPNVCSINRMMDALRDGIIDGYYILKIKYNRKEKNTKVFFVDVLDYVDCITCDGGTGQIMLGEKKFYKIYGTSGRENKLTLEEKTVGIYELYIKKMKEHIKRKEEQLEKRKQELILFL